VSASSDRLSGLAAGIVSSAIVGGISLLIYREAGVLPAAEIIFARGIVGLSVTTLLIWSRLPSLLGYDAAPIWIRAAGGAVSILAFSWNLQHTSVGMANMLFDFSLLVLLVIGYLGGEIRLTFSSVWTLSVAVVGTWVYWYGVNPALSFDVISIGIFGAVAAAIAYTAMKKATRTADPILIVWAGCVASIPVSLVSHLDGWIIPSGHQWVVLLFIGLGMLLSQYLLALSFRRLPLSLASALIPSSIVWSVLGEAITSGAHATPHAIAGTLIYTAGICGLAANGGRKSIVRAQEPSAA
jgi:drug/metabolite transporter (DMT)-like permease